MASKLGKRYCVEYTVTFRTWITVGRGEVLSDVISDIDIPENDNNQYVEDSFEELSCEIVD